MRKREDNIEIFEKNIDEYDKWYERNKEIFELEIKAIKKVIGKKKIKRSLEIGCGSGRFTKALGITDAVEPSKKLARYIKRNLGIRTKVAYAEKLPYSSNSFDMILLAFVYEFLKDQESALKEIFRVLKEKGVMIIAFLNKNAIDEKRYKNKLFYKKASFSTLAQLTKMLREVGFKITKKVGVKIANKEITTNQIDKAELIVISATKR